MFPDFYLIDIGNLPERRECRYLYGNVLHFRRRHRTEAGIIKGGRPGHFAHRIGKRLSPLDKTDTAAQLPLFLQSDKGAHLRLQSF